MYNIKHIFECITSLTFSNIFKISLFAKQLQKMSIPIFAMEFITTHISVQSLFNNQSHEVFSIFNHNKKITPNVVYKTKLSFSNLLLFKSINDVVN